MRAATVQIPISKLGHCECGAVTSSKCAWPMEKPTDVRVDELRVDDVLVHPRHGRRLRIFDIVAPGVGLLEILAEDGNPKLLTTKYLWPVNGRTLALRPGRCDEPVCELHAREVSEDRFYCRAHWNAWKDVT